MVSSYRYPLVTLIPFSSPHKRSAHYIYISRRLEPVLVLTESVHRADAQEASDYRSQIKSKTSVDWLRQLEDLQCFSETLIHPENTFFKIFFLHILVLEYKEYCDYNKYHSVSGFEQTGIA